MEKLRESHKPRTNPVHLIFLLSQYAPMISEVHFPAPYDFFDLVMRSTLSSKSRARAFLWLMWWYLESDFTREDALNNPFGPGLDGEGTEGLPVRVPVLESLTEEQADEENRDTPEELKYGDEKQRERKRILEEDEPLPRITKRVKKHDLGYDDDQIGSANSTPLHPSARRNGPNEEEEDWISLVTAAHAKNKRPNRDSPANRSSTGQRLVLKTKMDPSSADAASPAPPGSSHPIINQYVAEAITPSQSHSSRRPRPLTQHQLAVEQNRRHRIEYLLAQRKTEAYKVLRARRESEPALIHWARIAPNLLLETKNGDEFNVHGNMALSTDVRNSNNSEDFGETAHYYLSVTRKAIRRLDRWDWEKANGPSKDRKKAREERQKAYQNGTALAGFGGRATQSSRSARSRPRPPRRKPAAASSSSPSKGGQKSIAGTSGKTASQGANKLFAEKSGSGKAAATAASSSRDKPARDEAEFDGEEEAFDDVDKDGLGEASGHEDDDSELSYPEDDEHDEEGDDEELDEVEGEGDYSMLEGRNGYDSDSEVADDGDVEPAGDEDEVMEDQ
jgi:Ino eighty subunit 1